MGASSAATRGTAASIAAATSAIAVTPRRLPTTSGRRRASSHPNERAWYSRRAPDSQWSPAPSAAVKVTNSFSQVRASTSRGADAPMSSPSALQTQVGQRISSARPTSV